jgi:hypothetical protein
MKSDWTVEKKMLEQHLSGLKEQLREKEEKLNLVTAQKVLLLSSFFLISLSEIMVYPFQL